MKTNIYYILSLLRNFRNHYREVYKKENKTNPLSWYAGYTKGLYQAYDGLIDILLQNLGEDMTDLDILRELLRNEESQED